MSSSQPDRDPRLRSASPAWWAATGGQRDRPASRTWVDNPDEPTIVVPRPASGLPEAPAEVKEASGAETEITAEAPAEEAEAAAREPEVPIAVQSPAARPREDPAEARKPSGGQQAGAIPREPPDLLPRPDLLAELDRPDARVLELHSVSGAGATQLAAAYARARLDEGWRLVAWVSAGDTGTLLAGLAAIADALGLSESATAQDRTDPGEMLRRWLETAGDRCLLVLDGVTDPEALRPFIPAEGAARVVITSRQKSDLGRPVPVGAFSADEALAFLAKRTGLVDDAAAGAVAGELGHLPQALSLAASLIATGDLGYDGYLDRLRGLPSGEDLAGAERAARLSVDAVPAGGAAPGDGAHRGAFRRRGPPGPAAFRREGGPAWRTPDAGRGGRGAGQPGQPVAADVQPGRPGHHRRSRGGSGRPGRVVRAAAGGDLPGRRVAARGPGAVAGRIARSAGRQGRPRAGDGAGQGGQPGQPSRSGAGQDPAAAPVPFPLSPDRARRQRGAGGHDRRAADRRP